jgi:hypothetical protein
MLFCVDKYHPVFQQLRLFTYHKFLFIDFYCKIRKYCKFAG